jgi:hypothetical protein
MPDKILYEVDSNDIIQKSEIKLFQNKCLFVSGICGWLLMFWRSTRNKL